MLRCLTLCLLVTIVGRHAGATFSPRIVGGSGTDISKHPYTVSVRIKSCSTCAYLHKCGGSIYSDKVIITGAQCLVGLSSTDRVMVVAGSSSRTATEGVYMPVGKTIAHSGYNFWTIDNDIGLVILKDALPLGQFNVRSIGVSERAPRSGKTAVVSGWGWDAEDGASTHLLHDVEVVVVSNEACEEAYGAGEVTANMICAGASKGGRDGCQEDTGGPLVVDGELVGLVSWGRGCGREGYPGVYTRVSNYAEWISANVG